MNFHESLITILPHNLESSQGHVWVLQDFFFFKRHDNPPFHANDVCVCMCVCVLSIGIALEELCFLGAVFYKMRCPLEWFYGPVRWFAAQAAGLLSHSNVTVWSVTLALWAYMPTCTRQNRVQKGKWEGSDWGQVPIMLKLITEQSTEGISLCYWH